VSIEMYVLLKPALDAARAALRDLDGDQIPNDLRRVVAYGGGSLPPPHARSLLKGLEQYEWLREKAAEVLDGAPEDGGRGEASFLYLGRPDGWALRLAEIAASEGARAGSSADRAAAAKEQALTAKLEAARSRTKEIQRGCRAAVSGLERQIADLTAERRSESAAEARGDKEVREAVASVEEAAARYRGERDEARRAAAKAKQTLHEERSLRRKAENAAAGIEATGSWVGDDPEAMANRLDHTAQMARPPAPTPASPGAAVPTAPPALPAGVAPDGAAAIDWLLGVDGPVTVVVDGYNVGYLLCDERNPGTARERMEPVLKRLEKMGAGLLRVIVIYDSTLGPAETMPTPGSLGVRFSEAGHTADEAIIDLVGDLDGTVVVISGDREVREEAESLGATPLWSRALVSWERRR
jgi:hypothetical protein